VSRAHRALGHLPTTEGSKQRDLAPSPHRLCGVFRWPRDRKRGGALVAPRANSPTAIPARNAAADKTTVRIMDSP
jgi:hypothetical protein